ARRRAAGSASNAPLLARRKTVSRERPFDEDALALAGLHRRSRSRRSPGARNYRRHRRAGLRPATALLGRAGRLRLQLTNPYTSLRPSCAILAGGDRTAWLTMQSAAN